MNILCSWTCSTICQENLFCYYLNVFSWRSAQTRHRGRKSFLCPLFFVLSHAGSSEVNPLTPRIFPSSFICDSDLVLGVLVYCFVVYVCVLASVLLMPLCFCCLASVTHNPPWGACIFNDLGKTRRALWFFGAGQLPHSSLCHELSSSASIYPARFTWSWHSWVFLPWKTAQNSMSGCCSTSMLLFKMSQKENRGNVSNRLVLCWNSVQSSQLHTSGHVLQHVGLLIILIPFIIYALYLFAPLVFQ